MLGVVSLEREPDFPRFKSWLDAGKNASMAYMENHQSLREDPRELLAGVRSAIIFAMPYYLGDKHDPRYSPESPRMAQYAKFRDYHKILWGKGEVVMKELHQYHKAEGVGPVGRVLVDSAPILERSLAARSHLGFIGKNSCYIHPKKGSFLLLGEILTSMELPGDTKEPVGHDQRTELGGCGSCKRCQVACPTGALDEAYTLDANKCLAYWTIEHRGTIPEKYWPWLAYYYFGCDICQLVCPYNRGDLPPGDKSLLNGVGDLSLFEVATMSQKLYEAKFGGTPLTRAKRHGLRRNALIAMKVTQDPRLSIALDAVTSDDHQVLLDTKIQIRAYTFS